MTKIYSCSKQYSYKFFTNLSIRTILAILITPGLSYILAIFSFELFSPGDGYSYTFLEHLYPLKLLPFVYLMSVPLFIPSLLLFRAFRVSSVFLYVTLGFATGFLNYWTFFECYVTYEQYDKGAMNSSQAFHQIWQISDPGVASATTILWGLISFVFWLIVHWNVPIAPGSTSQDKQG